MTRYETKAGGDGRWRVDLAPMAACRKGRVLTVCGGRGATALPAVAVNDVLVGEVWLCAGQAAGTAAALCAKGDVSPRSLPYPELSSALGNGKVFLG